MSFWSQESLFVEQNITDNRTIPGWQKTLKKCLPNKWIKGLELRSQWLPVHILIEHLPYSHLKSVSVVLLEPSDSSLSIYALDFTGFYWAQYLTAAQLKEAGALSAKKTDGNHHLGSQTVIHLLPRIMRLKVLRLVPAKIYSHFLPWQIHIPVKSRPKRTRNASPPKTLISPITAPHCHHTLLGVNLAMREPSVYKHVLETTVSDWPLLYFLCILETDLFYHDKNCPDKWAKNSLEQRSAYYFLVCDLSPINCGTLSGKRESFKNHDHIWQRKKRNYEYICSISYICIKELFSDFSIHSH